MSGISTNGFSGNSGPIFIGDDETFIALASINNWSGNGGDEPFVIKDLEIDCRGGPYGIKIDGTTFSFVIRNCRIYNASGILGAGIHIGRWIGGALIDSCNITSCPNGIFLEATTIDLRNNSISGNVVGIHAYLGYEIEIVGNHCFDNEKGIFISESTGVIIVDSNYLENNTDSGLETAGIGEPVIVKNNTVRNNDFGILISNTPGSRITGNQLWNQDDHHIRIESDNVVVEDNIAVGYGDGLFLASDPRNVTVLNNTFIDNAEYGIFVEIGSKDNRFYGNRMVNCSFYLEPDIDLVRGQVIALNNTVNGKSVRHHVDLASISISGGAGQVILGNVSEVQLTNCDLSFGTIGAILSRCRNVSLSDCDLDGNIYYGFYGNRLFDCRISNSSLSGNYEGIRIYTTFQVYVADCSIKGNEVGADLIGLYLLEMHRNNISYNMAGVQNEYGGLPEQRSNLTSNVFMGNSDKALDLRTASSIVMDNSFHLNGIGVQFDQSTEYIINGDVFNNLFAVNGIGVDVKAGVIAVSWNQFSSNSIGIRFSSLETQESSADGNVFLDSIQYGIYLVDCNNVWLTDNTIMKAGGYGIEIFGSTNMLISGNELNDCSLHISGSERRHFSPHWISNTNTVDRRPIYYFMGNFGLIFDPDLDIDPGQVIIADYEDVFIEDVVFKRGETPLLLAFCLRVEVRNCSFDDQYIAAELYQCEDVLFDSCTISDSNYGLRAVHTSGLDIFECTFTNSSEVGMDLRIGSYINIMNSTIDGGAGNGINIQDCGWSLQIRWCVIKGMENAVHLFGTTSHTEIFDNVFAFNRGFGVVVEKGTRDNRIIDNSFNGNNRTVVDGSEVSIDPQVKCLSGSTEFGSNYWSGWEGHTIDPERDWIYDEPYWVGPGLNDFDNEPAVYPFFSILPWPLAPRVRMVDITSIEPIRLSFEIREGLKNAPLEFIHIETTTAGKQVNLSVPVTGHGEFEFFFERPELGEDIGFVIYSESIAGTSRKVSVKFPDSDFRPSIKILSPADGSILNTSSVSLTWNIPALPDDVKIIDRSISQNGGAFVSLGDPENNYPYLIPANEGANTLTVRITDSNGNPAMDTVNFTIDTIPPSFRIRDQGPSRDPVTVEWDFDHEENDTLRMWYKRPRSNWIEIDPMKRSFLFGLDEGTSIVEFIARDLAGNEFQNSIEIVVDMTPPEVVDWGPSAVQWEPNDKIWIKFSENMDISSIVVAIPGMDFSFEAVSDDELHISSLMVLDPGMKFNITVSGKDLAGNPMLPYTFIFSAGEGPVDHLLGTLIVLVTNREGDPLYGAKVTVFPLNQVFEQEFGSTIEYVLPPGEYELQVEAERYQTKVITVTIVAGTTVSKVVVLEEEESGQSIAPALILVGTFVLVLLAFLLLIIYLRSGEGHPEE